MTRDLLIEKWNPDEIDMRGNAFWHNERGKCHRDGDQPAVVQIDGTISWRKNGKHHRGSDKPAIIFFGGAMEWYKDGQLHREDDKPAIISPNGTMRWFKNGEGYHPSQTQKKKQLA